MPRTPGSPGHSGPPPSPTARRRNKRAVGDPTVLEPLTDEDLELDDEEGAEEDGVLEDLSDLVPVPPADVEWHQKAIDLYEGIAKSVPARLYEPSDWQFLQLLCEDYSRELKPRQVQVGVNGMGESILVEMEQPMPGAKLNALIKGLNSLVATEADRRRLQIVVERKSHKRHGEESQTARQRVTMNRLELLNGGKAS
jgi:hypothetical protein